MELNREQIIKVLECCTSESESCTGCPLVVEGKCRQSSLLKLALSLIKELTEENERLQDFVEEVQEYNESWVKDNRRLRGILLEFTDIVHKWGNKHGYDTSEISLAPILNEKSAIKKQIQCDTVRKMQERLKKHLEKPEFPWDSFTVAEEVIDQIAKEMLKEKEK